MGGGNVHGTEANDDVEARPALKCQHDASLSTPYTSIAMVRSTTIFRISDGLPLAASVDDETVSRLESRWKLRSRGGHMPSTSDCGSIALVLENGRPRRAGVDREAP